METRALAMKAGVVACLAVAADQATKSYIRAALAVSTAPPAFTDRLDLGPLGLVRVENAGSVFGLFQGLWLWIILAILGVCLIPIYACKLPRSNWAAALAAGFQAGGALGNLADRLIYGGVTDFIDLGRGPIFNLADLFIVADMALGVWMMLRATFFPGVAARLTPG